jgi:hypothetical protein
MFIVQATGFIFKYQKAQKGFPGASTLAYFALPFSDKVKSFITLSPDVICINRINSRLIVSLNVVNGKVIKLFLGVIIKLMLSYVIN